jgi:phosphatidylserine/phosphatidylglycerophosphate/cardiolipin synthase-like enzyme
VQFRRRARRLAHGFLITSSPHRLPPAFALPARADPAPTIHYAPAKNLEHIDVALIDRAKHEVDMAAYVLTDWAVMQALTRAADRGVKARIYLDGKQVALSLWDRSHNE